MTDEKLRLLFDLAEELYAEEYKKAGMLTPIPYAYATDNDSGAMVVVTSFSTESKRLKSKLEEL